MTPRTRRPKADWVYRGMFETPGSEPPADPWVSEAQGLASYTEFVGTFAAGPTSARFLVLYDSRNRLAELASTWSVAGGFNSIAMMPRAARAEGKKPLILASEGQIYLRANTWALGNIMAWGYRIGVFEQDPLTGLVVLNADYSMWNTSADWNDQVSTWANQSGWVQERRFWRTFNADFPSDTSFSYRWRGRRRLKEHECFGIYLEAESTSVNMLTQPWCRTLVSDEG